MRTMKEAIEFFRSTGKDVYFVFYGGREIGLDEWEDNLKQFGTLDLEINDCEWTVRFK